MNGSERRVYVSVWLYKKGFVPAGAILFDESVGVAGFSYFESYTQKDYPPLNPATLNYRDTGSRHFLVDSRVNREMLDKTFWELLPTRGDFGEQLLISKHPHYASMNAAQKLYFLGNRTVGGLSCYIEKQKDEKSIDSLDWLDHVRRESVAFHLKEIQKLGDWRAIEALTSYGGVRPKAMYRDAEGRNWIVKFNMPPPIDPYDMAVAEHVAMSMAKDCGMRVPETKIVQLPSGENVFFTERFDREGDERFHGLSLFALLPGIEHEKKTGGGGLRGNLSSTMAAIVRRYSDFKDVDTANLVSKLLIDVGFNNTDNHLRNTRMILNREGKWELSPMFDVVFNPRGQPHVYNPGGLAIEDTFLNNDALVDGIAKQVDTDPQKVHLLREKVVGVCENWREYCESAGMSSDDMLKIEAAVSLGLSRVELQNKLVLERRKKIESIQRMSINLPKPR